MTDLISLTGLIATEPRHLITSEGLPITSFRLASAQRRFDRTQERWVDADTNWYTITAFRQLAVNVAASLGKGQRVVITGRLRIRDWNTGEKTGTTVEIDADSIGHDLAWGTTVFTRSIASAVVAADAAAASAVGVQAATEQGATSGVSADAWPSASSEATESAASAASAAEGGVEQAPTEAAEEGSAESAIPTDGAAQTGTFVPTEDGVSVPF